MCFPYISIMCFAPVQFYGRDVLWLSASKSSSHKKLPPSDAKQIPTETAHGLGSREQQQKTSIFYMEKDFSTEIRSYSDLLDSTDLISFFTVFLLGYSVGYSSFFSWCGGTDRHWTPPWEKLYWNYLQKKSEGGTSEQLFFLFSF